MKSIFYIFVSAALGLGCICFADSENSAKSNANFSRDDAIAASKSFNAAVDSAAAYRALLSTSYSETSNMAKNAESLLQRAQNSANSLSELGDKLGRIKTEFEECLAGTNSSAQNLSESVKSLPIGEKLENRARVLIDEISDSVQKNPGKNYQDKYYFDRVKSRYEVAKGWLENAQSEAVKIGSSASLIKPRVDGITSTLAMCSDYIGKFDALAKSNLESATKTAKVADALTEEISSKLKNYAKLGKLCAAARAKTLADFFKFCENALNADASKKIASGISGDLQLREIQPFTPSTAVSRARIVKSKKADNSPFAARNLAEIDSKFAVAAAAREGSNTDMQKNIRAEILTQCAEIEEITARIDAAAVVLNQQNQAARAAMTRLERFSDSVGGLLSDSIEKLADSQKLSSEILLLEIRQRTLESQNKLATETMQKLFEAARKGFENASK